ncbi:hypothetical protein GCM10009789_72760 [Kribbella sancticallisti]|uniref:DUF3558 domain-containing protein n=1 Tax=Kribbella sancticallisti TaxID=460087 RepID=A0ABP4QDV3_9ACTN
MPEPEDELGPKIADAFQTKADAVRGLRERGLAAEARRRIRKRRQTLIAGAAAVVVAFSIGGVWGAIGGPSPIATSQDSSSSAGGSAKEAAPEVPATVTPCPEQHPVLTAGGHEAVPLGTGLDLEMPVYGLQACRYRVLPDNTMLLGSQSFNATTAQQIVDAIKVLPERNPDLPVFKCAPELAKPSEAIVLRFDTASGIREVWVGYDGCASAGFFTGSRTYGLYAAPLKLFMKGTVRPTEGTYLDHLEGW